MRGSVKTVVHLLKLFAAAVYLGLLAFALFNYCDHCDTTEPKSLMVGSDEGKCKLNWDEMGVKEVHRDEEVSEAFIEAQNPNVLKGGAWAPKDCKPWQTVAIIIPYRDRMGPLKKFLRRIHPHLQAQKLRYRIILAEQYGDGQFNRGKLFNMGFLEAMKLEAFDCVVFHDVDLLPEDDRNLYLCDNHGRHLETATDDLRYHLKYYNYAGGVVAISAANFKKINGYANNYWGWGNEDDDFSARITESGMKLTRPPEKIGRYQMVPHKKNSRASSGNSMFFGWKTRWATDGLYDPVGMNYTLKQVLEAPLYTRVIADIGAPPPGGAVTWDRSKDISLWWFLTFYYP